MSIRFYVENKTEIFKKKNMTSLCFHHIQQNFKMKLNNGNEYLKIKLKKKV